MITFPDIGSIALARLHHRCARRPSRRSLNTFDFRKNTEAVIQIGGPSGIRDLGLLESALARPMNRYAYGEEDLAALAANYAFGIARNHPFIDGNKRAAFAAFIVFPGLNGVNFKVPPEHATASILALAAGDIDENGFTRWVRDNWPPGL